MNIKAVRGTKDILFKDSEKFNNIVNVASEVFENYGYGRIITPIFEETALFKRGIGEGTDIVEKEMYTFEDKGGRSVTLRPEGTASVVRSYLEHKIGKQEEFSKFYYFGPMFRYERPQAGRYREFNQLGVEAFGSSEAVLDAEVISLGYGLLEKIGIEELEVQINSVGGKESRIAYREKLVDYLSDKVELLCEDCKTRYEKNPLRVLDCKVKSCQEATKDAPVLTENLSEEETAHYEEVKKYLDAFDVKYTENPKLVRGLDYYSKTVFEIVTNKLGAQGTVLAGGRYDGLVETMGGKATPGVGFAAGVERIMLLLDQDKLTKKAPVAIVWLGEESKEFSFKLAERLRKDGVKINIELKSKSMRAQMKKIDKLGAKYAIIIGEDEMKNNQVQLKNLKERTQTVYSIEDVVAIWKGE